MTQTSVHIPPQMWTKFQISLRNCRVFNEEVIGFLFCQRQQISKHQIRYISKTWVVPAADCYEHQSSYGLVLNQHFHSYLLENHLHPGVDMVHIHTHAGGNRPDFSEIDDRYESEYARFIADTFPTKPRLISGVFDENLQHSQFRMWNRQGNGVEQVRFCNSLFDTDAMNNSIELTDLMFARQQIFGTGNQKFLNNLKVCLIGCGGIGSIVAESLGRLGVKNWLLIDPDRLEIVNLNRMPGATPEMVEQNWHKVHYVKHLIKQIYPEGSVVKTIPTSISDRLVEPEIASCDLIVVATDNHFSRQIAQELALKYLRPLVSLGTHIEVKADGSPRMYARVTVPPLGGGWCLMCGNIINLQRAALESAPREIERIATNLGYIEGVNDPAVFWLNSICASTGVGVIQGMVSGFVNVDAGIDWIYEFPSHEWLKTNVEHLRTANCYFCG